MQQRLGVGQRRGVLVELLDHDPHRLRARMSEAEHGDFLGQGLDEIDVTARDDRLDALDDLVLVRGLLLPPVRCVVALAGRLFCQ